MTTHTHKPKKSLGQNFLKSKTVVSQILKTAKLTGKDHVIEIGPGLGILTIPLSKIVKKVTAIELDPELIPILEEKLTNVEIINQDALKFQPPKTTKYKVVANIPYYITSPLITHFLTNPNPPTSLTLLVQKEVAEKIVIDPPSSILALQAQLYAKPHKAFKVPAKHFSPQPKVDSAVIHLETLPKSKRPQNPQQILTLAKLAFSQKRKKLSNTLKEHREALTKLGLQDKRPQHLSIKDWEELSS
jgi:16S rRNA (adenine1518-N6/adenine1519-N6)-dimethyltransferase